MFTVRSTLTKSVSVTVAASMFSAATPSALWSDIASSVINLLPEHTLVQTRFLTEEEMNSLRGRTVFEGTAANQYIAGQSKWSVNYRGVDLLTGNFSFSETDLSFEGGYGIPVAITRTYSANNPDEGPLGRGWTLSVDLRTTAGGLLKGGGSASRSVPVRMQEKELDDKQPGYEPEALTLPAQWLTEGVVAEDASGRQNIITRDVDGVLTPPAWDKNKVETEYVDRVVGGEVIQFTDHITVTTPEGTVYYYDELGYEPHDTVQGAPGKSSVMKIVSVTDRHGNATTYTYDTGQHVMYNRWSGDAYEYRLSAIDMPGGRGFDFYWGNDDRLDSVTDGDRTVTYGYDSGSTQVTDVTKPGGYLTQYEYGDPESYPVEPGVLLRKITDPRGFETKLFYKEGLCYTPPLDGSTDAAARQGVFCYKIDFHNSTKLVLKNWLNVGSSDYAFTFNAQATDGRTGAALIADGVAERVVYVGADQGQDTYTVTSWRDYQFGRQPCEDAIYDLYSHDLLVASSSVYNYSSNLDLDEYRRFDPPAFAEDYEGMPSLSKAVVTTTTHYNYFGAPLEKSVHAERWLYNGGNSEETQVTSYAYWGDDKYFQQKAVVGPDGSASFTDYFTTGAAAGKGQVMAVYEEKHSEFSPKSGTGWRGLIAVSSGSDAAATFTYDDEGRPLTVSKLRNTATNEYVVTKTEYSGAQNTYGNATKVIEDFGGINRTTETLQFDEIGRAEIVKDATNRQIQTFYDDAGNVEEVKRISGTPKTLATYGYGETAGEPDFGMLTWAIDHVDGIRQVIKYYDEQAVAYEKGQVERAEEWTYPAIGMVPNYTVAYDYTPAGDRWQSTYTTPNGTKQYLYEDYISVGTTDDKRVFRTMIAVSGQSPEQEEFQYAYDSSGRLVHAAFMQSQRVINSVPHSYDSEPASSRGHAYYLYDAAGRIEELHTLFGTYHYDDGAPQNEHYSYDKVTAQDYGYNEDTGLREHAYFFEKSGSGNAWQQIRHEIYGYDVLGQLTSANYGGNTTSWEYDPAGNRSHQDLTTYTYDKLNRMSASPGGATYQHDILGNRTWKNYGQSSVQRYVWDEMGRLSSLCGTTQGADYTYRVDGLRTKKVEGLTISWVDDQSEESEEEASGYYDEHWATNKPTTRYYYDGQMGFEDDYTVAGIGQNNNVTVTRYALGARGIDGIETTVTGQGSSVVYPVYDGHGNMIATLAKGSQPNTFTKQHDRTYDAWGNITSGSAGDQGYVANLGHRKDAESGLTYMRARYYEPGTGRFISQDPAMHGWNWFSYVNNNPIKGVDPSGMYTEEELKWALGQTLVGLYMSYTALVFVGSVVLAVGVSALTVLLCPFLLAGGVVLSVGYPIYRTGIAFQKVHADSGWLGTDKGRYGGVLREIIGFYLAMAGIYQLAIMALEHD